MKKALFLGLLAVGCGRHVGTADAEAWVHMFYPKATSVTATCAEFDTDQNGYVSCTVKADDMLVGLECPNNQNTGCNSMNDECRLARGNAAN